ncbi:MAG: peptidoglycan DD-metalloendopeptidase family protein [Chloroflexota bacterium]|nr:peptidoglycan DD-metalloendopeptidase family protein [Chloroflexota bacterium]
MALIASKSIQILEGYKIRNYLNLILALLLFWPLGIAQAQEQQPDGPIYIVQAGDTLWDIAQQFGVSMDDLIAENGIADPGQLAVGARLVIPGLEGIQGLLITATVPYGENLKSLSRRYQISDQYIARLNHYTSPGEIYAGSTLIVPETESDDTPVGVGRVTLRLGQSLLELAITHDTAPWNLMLENQTPGLSAIIPGETLYLTGRENDNDGPGALPEAISAVETSSPLIQGQTLSIELTTPEGASLQGHFHDQNLNFFRTDAGTYAALQGIYAMLAPGLYPVTIEGQLADGTPLNFSQQVYVRDGNYAYDPPLVVDSETTDAHNNEVESEQWFSLVEPVTSEKLWDGAFQSPVPAYFSECFPSLFGNRRSYNESGYEYFHSGLDYCGSTGTDIYAPAPGKVIFIGELTVRGNATVVDHGWGVYTAYAHQSEFLVAEGDQVETGQLIGKVGVTGRVTGPHLHWEVIVGGVQVDPLQWLQQTFP